MSRPSEAWRGFPPKLWRWRPIPPPGCNRRRLLPVGTTSTPRGPANRSALRLEIGGGLAGEAYHHVGAHGAIRHQGARLRDAVRVVPRTVLAMHAPQDAVAAGLQRRVYVAGDAGGGGHEAQQVVGEIHRLHGTEAQAVDGRSEENT